jgi:hypothetical protein
MEDNVKHVNDVHEVVQREPDDQRLPGDLREAEPEDDDPEVVEEGQGNDHRPVVAQPPGGVEDERPVASGRQVSKVCHLDKVPFNAITSWI